MFITKFYDFLFERKKYLLKYNIFDWDDNILYMSTVIHMDKKIDGKWVPEDVSTSKYASIRKDSTNWRLLNADPNQAYSEFSDLGPRKDKAFFQDAMSAINNKKYGPSWKSFIDCLINGRYFMIVTSRSHSQKTIKNVVEWIVYNVLDDKQQNEMVKNLIYYHGLFDRDIDYVLDQYFENCLFFGVGDPLNSYVKSVLMISSENIEKRKEMAIAYFKNKLIKYGEEIDADISIGFSDDDKKITSHIVSYMGNEKRLDFMSYRKKLLKSKIGYYVYDTSDPNRINKITI